MTHRVWGGFHGKGGSPKQLFLNHPTDPTLTECWTPKHRIGNPYFEGQDTVFASEIDAAYQFMVIEQPEQLIAYSRGGSIYTQMVAQHRNTPKHFIIFVAAAWKRFWPSGSPILPDRDWNGIIIHGDSDGRVPLKWSVELSQQTGMPLIILRDVDHIGTIFDAPFSERIRLLGAVAPQTLPLDDLPDWQHRMDYNSDEWTETVTKQQTWVDTHWRLIHPDVRM